MPDPALALPRLPFFGWSAFAGPKRSSVPCIVDRPDVVFTRSGQAAIGLALGCRRNHAVQRSSRRKAIVETVQRTVEIEAGAQVRSPPRRAARDCRFQSSAACTPRGSRPALMSRARRRYVTPPRLPSLSQMASPEEVSGSPLRRMRFWFRSGGDGRFSGRRPSCGIAESGFLGCEFAVCERRRRGATRAVLVPRFGFKGVSLDGRSPTR